MPALVRTALAVILASAAVCAQSPDAPPAFEIADVHVSPRSSKPSVRGGFYRGGRYELHMATMVDLIRIAWNLDDKDKVIGGPSWLDDDRFDVIAKAPGTTTPETARLMLRTLLADRFSLAVHEGTRPLEAYALTMGKRAPLMKEAAVKDADATTSGGCQDLPQSADGGAISVKAISCHNMTMATLAEQLPYIAPAYFGGFRMVDLTGLKGAWDFNMKWTFRGELQAAGSDGISMVDAIDRQLGLKMELQKIPTPVVFVDKVNEKPTENLPGVTKNLPAAPTEFEVAVIKPSLPGATPNERISPGRVELRGTSLKELVKYAWSLEENNDDMLAGPKWLDTERFDIIARAPADGPSPPQMDEDALRLMLRNLLLDRFKMTVHKENRPVLAYALTSAKPKLRTADPSNRTGCKATPAAAGASSPLSRSYTCQNITMTQLAVKMPWIAFDYMDHPVVDAAELSGAWDFVVSFSPQRLMQTGGAGGASEPTGRITVFEAMEKQLGVKLETRKVPMEVLVIDRMEPKPTEN